MQTRPLRIADNESDRAASLPRAEADDQRPTRHITFRISSDPEGISRLVTRNTSHYTLAPMCLHLWSTQNM